MATTEDTIKEEEATAVDDEYCVQYFGFHPQSFMNGMYNVVCEYLQEAMKALNDAIISRGKVSEVELKEVSRRSAQTAIKRLDAKFDVAEAYLMNNVFTIPPYLVLPSDRKQIDLPCTEEEMRELDLDIQEATDKIIAVKYANVLLQERLGEIKTLQEEFDPFLESLDNTLLTVSSEGAELVQSFRARQQLTALMDKCRLKS